MSRATYLRVDEVRVLDHWCRNLGAMFGEYVVSILHCGSSLERPDYRDVDVRVVLDDEAVAAIPMNLLDLNMLLSRWGQAVTNLPIDCQVQSLTESGAEAAKASARPQARQRYPELTR